MRMMFRLILMALCLTCLALRSPAGAEEAQPQTKSEEQWLVELRNSASYEKGLEEIRQRVDLAYDSGAIAGAKHWETVNSYYFTLARAKGCKTAMQLADGPTKECQKVAGSEPTLRGAEYQKGRDQIVALSRETLRPTRTQDVLLNIYDFGYVQGMRHGLRQHHDDLEWKQAYYKACVTRTADAQSEPVCATESKRWSAALLDRLSKQIESFGASTSKKIE